MNIKCTKAFFCLLFFLTSFAFGAKPNIIIILADDLGYGDLGVQGAKDLITPAIDELAADGIRFTDGYACHAFCGPSRAGLMTGRYPHRYGSQTNPPHSMTDETFGVPVEEVFISQALKEQGYATGIVGKWHLGAAPRQRPDAKGFDYFGGFLEGSHAYFTEGSKDYLTDTLTDNALNFVEKNKDNPFFLYLAYNAPHTPFQAKKDDLAKFSHIKDPKRKTYAAMIYALDRGVADLIAKLKSLGIYENTLIVFASDNGGVLPYSSNGALTGEKRKSSNEGSHRVPFIVTYKGKVAPAVSSQVVTLLDLFPTFLSVAGGEIPSNLDGVDISKFIFGEAEIGDRENFIDMGAEIVKTGDDPIKRNSVRFGKWKLISNGDRSIQSLYDLESDIAENKNLAKDFPEILESLNKRFAAWDLNNIPVRYKHKSQYKDSSSDKKKDKNSSKKKKSKK